MPLVAGFGGSSGDEMSDLRPGRGAGIVQRGASAARRPGSCRRQAGIAAVILAAVATFTAPARADGDGPDDNGITAPSIATSFPDNADALGARKWLARHGISYNTFYINDALANVRGGRRRGAIDQGRLEGQLTIDFETLAGLPGLKLYSNVINIHNTGRLRRDIVGSINTIAAIEADPTTRLSELWLEQGFANGQASLRAGQLAVDVEFFQSFLSGTLFLQSDWATIGAANLPSGGPAYPLATPGVRLKVDPTAETALLVAVFNGDPAGPGAGDEQMRNRHGLNFRVNDPPFVIAEARWQHNQGKDDSGLATTVKTGAWQHFGTYDDLRFADDATLMADPRGSGSPAKHRGNSGIYAVFEQQLYRPAGADAQGGVSVFGRISASPSDRSPISFFVDAGIVVAGVIPDRPDDRFGISYLYAKFSDGMQSFERDVAAFAGVPALARDFEANLELTYKAQIVPGWTVQPVLTYVWHPNGGLAGSNATVLGARSIWQF
jgi:porin